MSLIDPSTRWWNRYGVRRGAAWGCWIASMLVIFTVGWAFGAVFAPDDGASFRPQAFIPILFPVGLILLLAGGCLYFLSEEDDSEFKPRVIFFPLACLFMAQGLGDVAYRLVHGQPLEPIALGFAALGAAGLMVGEAIIRRRERNQVVRERVERSGIKTRGEVTRARGYFVNHWRVTRVTVAFVDQAGRKRWASQTVDGAVRVGQAVTVRYSAEHLDRRAGVIVEPGFSQ